MNTYLKNILTLSILGFSSLILSADPIKLVGSDIIDGAIGDKIITASKSAQVELDKQMKGSRNAWKMVTDGSADIAIVALPDDQNIPDGLSSIPLASQVVVVAVNDSNPETEINIDQLGRMFGRDGSVETWQQVGLNKMTSKNTSPITTNLKDNLVVELFKHKCMNNVNVSASVQSVVEPRLIPDMIRTNSNAIAIVGMIEEKNGVKILAVSRAKQDPMQQVYSFKPTRENVYNGDYPLSLKFYLVYKTQNIAKIKTFLSLMLSDDIANALETKGLYSIPQSFRKSFILSLDISK